MDYAEENTGMTRRDLFRVAGTAGVACLAAAGTLGWAPRASAASPVEAVIAEKVGAGKVTMEKVVLGAPDKAENGAMVRIPVSVTHPQEAGNYIEQVLVFVDNNPKPFVGSFSFTPEIGQVSFEVRVKVAQTSDVRVIARTNKGALFGATKKVEVAEGGCAG